MRPVRYGIRIGAAFVGLATVGLLAAACGGKGSGSGANPTTAQSASVQAYIQCLQQHGVNITVPSGRPSGVRPSTTRSPGTRPSRSPGAGGGGGGGGGAGGFNGGFLGSEAPSGVDQQVWQAAQTACAAVRPSFGPGRNGGGNNSAMTAYRNCLRDHGVTASGGLNNLSTADPKVAAAIQACAPLRPSDNPGRGASPTS